MKDLSDLPLFSGVPTAEPPSSKPMRQRRPKAPTPAEKAAAGRLEGARRIRPPQSPGQRTRVGHPRDLSPAPVLAFPLARNASVVAEVLERLPHGYARDLDRRSAQEARKLQKGLMQRGLSKQSAWQCAREVVHLAYIERVKDAHREAGIL